MRERADPAHDRIPEHPVVVWASWLRRSGSECRSSVTPMSGMQPGTHPRASALRGDRDHHFLLRGVRFAFRHGARPAS